LFWLKIASSGRGALAGTRCVHLSCKNKGTEDSANIEGSREGQYHDKKPRSTKTHWRKQRLTNLSVASWGCIGATAPAATRKTPSRLPVPRNTGSQVATGGLLRSRSPSRGPVSRHLTKTKRPPPEWHNSSGVVLPDDVDRVTPAPRRRPNTAQ
jgi:hypothetical protein